MLKIGCIGFGKMGKIRAKATKEVGLGEVVAVYDKYMEDNEGYPEKSSPEEIIQDPTIDAVFVCTPNHRNKELTIQSLQAGKHVFCEKPPAFTSEDVKEIIAAEKASQKTLMYGFNHRHHESIQKMKGIIERGDYGRILWMRGRYGKSVDETFYGNWRSKKELSGGGILLDQGIHMLDLFLYLANDFDETHAFVSNLYWQLDGIEDNVFAIFRNSTSGVVASLHSTMTQWRHLFSLEVFLEAGYLVLNGLKTSSGTYGEEILSIAKNRTEAPAATWSDEEKHSFTINSSWNAEVSMFLKSILDKKPVAIGNSEDALKVMTLIDNIYQNKIHKSEGLSDKLSSI